MIVPMCVCLRVCTRSPTSCADNTTSTYTLSPATHPHKRNIELTKLSKGRRQNVISHIRICKNSTGVCELLKSGLSGTGHAALGDTT